MIYPTDPPKDFIDLCLSCRLTIYSDPQCKHRAHCQIVKDNHELHIAMSRYEKRLKLAGLKQTRLPFSR